MKKVMIIGATSGIGRRLAEMYTAEGWRVAALGRRAEKLDDLKRQFPQTVTVAVDVSHTADLETQLEAVAAELGGVDLLIISAGTGDLNPALDFAIEKTTVDTNVAGFTLICGWAMGYFEKQGFGHLAAITSVAGLRGTHAAPAYNATKAYQINYLEALRQRVAKNRASITVTDIRPGLVDTDMAKGEGLFWVAPVEKAARQIHRTLARHRKVAYVTKRWRLVAAILKAIPRFAYERMG